VTVRSDNSCLFYLKAGKPESTNLVLQITARELAFDRDKVNERCEMIESPKICGRARLLLTFAVAAIWIIGSSDGVAAWEIIKPKPTIAYEIRIIDPGSGVIRVRAEFSREAIGKARKLALTCRDLPRHPNALKDFRVRSIHSTLSFAVGSKGKEHVRVIDLGKSTGPVTIEYTMDPTFYPPGSRSRDASDARARLGKRLAVLRTSSLFPTYDRSFDSARVVFVLPKDWTVAAPWLPDGDGFVLSQDDQRAVDYLGLGLLEVRKITVGNIPFIISASINAERVGAEKVSLVVRYFLDLVGSPPPVGSGTRSVVSVPVSFMRGGAAGNRSIVQGTSPIILAHELFHWWTHSDLVQTEAKWFSEGFTNYFAVKAASEAGLITNDEAAQCFSDLAGEMRLLEKNGARSLRDVSVDYFKNGRAQRLVYSKGTLLALFIERKLDKRNQSMDEMIRKVLSKRRRGLSNSDLGRFFAQQYGSSEGAHFFRFLNEDIPLPRLGLGPATGDSGCARYLPGR
jgi:hypothetical protein